MPAPHAAVLSCSKPCLSLAGTAVDLPLIRIDVEHVKRVLTCALCWMLCCWVAGDVAFVKQSTPVEYASDGAKAEAWSTIASVRSCCCSQLGHVTATETETWLLQDPLQKGQPRLTQVVLSYFALCAG